MIGFSLGIVLGRKLPGAGVPPPPSTFEDIVDIQITSPQDGDELVYEDGVWVNK